MALSRLLLVTCALLAVMPCVSLAQINPTTANQDGILIMDALGRFFSAPMNEGSIGAFLFQELEDSSQSFGFPFPVAKDFEFVAHPDGTPKGVMMLDSFGGQHSLNIVGATEMIPNPFEFGQFNETFATPPFFGFDVAQDLEIAPDWRTATHGYRGYFVLDADGVVHVVGETNLPRYAFITNPNSIDVEDAIIFQTLFPETIDVSGSTYTPERLLLGGPLDIPVNRPYTSNTLINSVTPIFTYFGANSNIARDLEVSVEYVTITMPSRINVGALDTRTIMMTNGYYILDGRGAVHSARLPLDFDVDNNGLILYTDLYSDFDNDELNEDFGRPINNTVISPPWVSNRGDLPYFGSDVAVDIEITPSGNGFYLLDVYGGTFAVGDAHFNFPPRQSNGTFVPSNTRTPYFGFPIAKDMSLVNNAENTSLGLHAGRTTVGYLVLDGFGTIHTAGLATSFNVSETGDRGRPITVFADIFRAMEVTPVTGPATGPIRFFSVGNEDIPVSVAPNFRNVTASFTTVSAPQ